MGFIKTLAVVFLVWLFMGSALLAMLAVVSVLPGSGAEFPSNPQVCFITGMCLNSFSIFGLCDILR